MVTSAALRVAFFGTPEFAVPSLAALIESRHEVVALMAFAAVRAPDAIPAEPLFSVGLRASTLSGLGTVCPNSST